MNLSSTHITNEFNSLKSVILGTPESFGGTPELSEAYDPKSKEHIKNGTFPSQKDISTEMDEFNKVLTANGVKVYRPKTIDNYNQIFSRDIGCVIDNFFLVTNMIEERSREIEAITHILDELPAHTILRAPLDVRFEGGDIMPHNDYIFVGYSEEEDFKKYKVSRTNRQGLDFLKSKFSEKKVKGFELNKSDTNPKENALHLDCCFQPFGLGHALIHEKGFKNNSDFEWLVQYFGESNCLKIDKDQMYEMGCNLFSIAPDHIISDHRFDEINEWLTSKGYKVSKINYGEISKMEGLLRCSTLPLCRE